MSKAYKTVVQQQKIGLLMNFSGVNLTGAGDGDKWKERGMSRNGKNYDINILRSLGLLQVKEKSVMYIKE